MRTAVVGRVYRALMQPRHCRTNGQPEPGSGACRLSAAAVKLFENIALMPWRQSRPVVCHCQLPVRIAYRDDDTDGAASRDVTQSVVQQIAQGLHKQARIAPDHRGVQHNALQR
nr:hypothetical protein [Polaromonas eurypsychrophila]